MTLLRSHPDNWDSVWISTLLDVLHRGITICFQAVDPNPKFTVQLISPIKISCLDQERHQHDNFLARPLREYTDQFHWSIGSRSIELFGISSAESDWSSSSSTRARLHQLCFDTQELGSKLKFLILIGCWFMSGGEKDCIRYNLLLLPLLSWDLRFSDIILPS